ncbi:MAG: ATP synthase F1 subunit gamma [Saprospiraceae bacterium]
MAGNLKEVRDRIASVNNTQQITKAMKMVSAAKLRRAQDAIVQMRPYANKLDAMLRNILSNLEGDSSSVFGQERPVERACIVVITSNRGLCGAFNSNVIKAGLAALQGKYADVHAKGNLSMLFIGKKGLEYFRKRYSDSIHIITDYVNLFEDLSFDNTKRVSSFLMGAFEEGRYDAVEVAYGEFRNAAMQNTIHVPFLPVPKVEMDEEKGSSHRADYIFEPGKEGLLSHLIPSILQTQFHKFNLDTHASEHGARMTAMDSATTNANDLLRDLRISYNKARQEAITGEILEIVGGAAALESS